MSRYVEFGPDVLLQQPKFHLLKTNRFSKNVRTITKKLTEELKFTILNTKVDETLLVSQAIMFDILNAIEN